MSGRTKIYEVAFQVGGKMDRSFKGSMLNAQKSLMSLNKQISNLESNRAGVKKFRQLKKQVGETEQKMRSAQDEVSRLAKEISAAEKPTRKLAAEFERAKKKAKTLKDKLLGERTEIARLNRAMGQAGISTRNLASDNAALERRLNKTRIAQQKLNSTLLKQKSNSDLRDKKRGQLVDAAAIGYTAYKVINPFGNIASAQGGLASLGISEKGIGIITKAGIAAANTWSSITAPAFIEGSYDIKSGIASLGDTAIAEYTRMAAVTAKATKYSTEQMTGLYATGFGIYRKQFDSFAASTITGWKNLSNEEKDIKFGEYFSAGIAASVQAYKTKGEEMQQYFTTLGATATSAGASFAEQLAIGGYLQRTMPGSEAATKYASFENSAFKAGKSLKLNFVDEQTGALKSIPDILDLIKEKYGELDAESTAEIKDAFGRKEASDLVKLLIGDTDELRKSIEFQNKALKDGMSLPEEMARAFERGPNATIGLLVQRVNNLCAALGERLDPTVTFVTNNLGKLAIIGQGLVEKFPKISSLIATISAGTAALGVTLIAGGYAFSIIRGGVLGLKVAYLTLNSACLLTRGQLIAMSIAQKAGAAVTGVMTAAQWALNVALNANPIGLVVAGVAALAGAAVLVYKYWEPISGFFAKIWEKIKSVFAWLLKLKRFIPGLKDDMSGLDIEMASLQKAAASPRTTKHPSGGVTQNNNIPVNVTVNGGDPQAVTRAVQSGINNSVMDSRRRLAQERRLAYE